jgi:uncharacterized protein
LNERATVTERGANSCAIGILARAPIAGRAKTRLIPVLGAEGAARFQASSLLDTDALVSALGWPSRLFLSPISARSRVVSLGASVPIDGQGGGLLGTRMARALERLLALTGVDRALLIGTDSPDLPRVLLESAAESLREHAAVLVPAADGGYVLIGLRGGAVSKGTLRRILSPVAWSTPHTCRDTVRSLRANGVDPALLDPWSDVDGPDDLLRMRERIRWSRLAGEPVPLRTAALLDEID